MNPKEANDAASFLCFRYDPDRKTLTEQVERGAFPPILIERVRKMGLELDEMPQKARSRGAVVNIAIDPETGDMEGAVPSLYNGAALGY